MKVLKYSVIVLQVTDFPTSVLLAAVNSAIGPTPVSAAKVFETVSKQGTVIFPCLKSLVKVHIVLLHLIVVCHCVRFLFDM